MRSATVSVEIVCDCGQKIKEKVSTAAGSAIVCPKCGMHYSAIIEFNPFIANIAIIHNIDKKAAPLPKLTEGKVAIQMAENHIIVDGERNYLRIGVSLSLIVNMFSIKRVNDLANDKNILNMQNAIAAFLLGNRINWKM